MYDEIVASVSIDGGACRQWYTFSEHRGPQVEVFHKGGNIYPHGTQLGPKGRSSNSTLSKANDIAGKGSYNMGQTCAGRLVRSPL